ncbi:Excinuclease ABC, C subunit, partial [Prunus dulcis]
MKFTVNTRRRIRQHNGEITQSAWRTKRKRPWEMFEWAWQHPTVSKAVRQAAASFKSLGGLLEHHCKLLFNQYTKHSAGCPRLPEQMKVKVCSMDELPSCTKLSDDLLENEDEWCHERECDEDMNSSTLPEETLLDFRTHNSADDQQSDSGNRMNEVYGCNDAGKIINEAYGCSEVVGEDCTEQFGFMASPVRTPSSNGTTSFDTEVTKDIGLCGSSDDMSVDLGRPAREQSTAIVADDDQSPSRSYLRPCGAE